MQPAQPRRRRWDPPQGALGDLGATGTLPWGQRGAGKAKAAARAYPVDLGQPPLLPGFEQTEGFPSWRRQRGGRGSRGVSLRAARPRPAPTPRAPQTPPSAPRAQVAGGGHRARAGGVAEARAGGQGAGQGRGPAGAPRCLPWNLLLSATDMVSTRLPPARGFAAASEGRGGGAGAWSELAQRVAAGPRGGGMARAAGHSPPPSLPARPAPLPLPSAPRRRHQSGYYAGRRARRPAPLLEDAENAPCGGLPGAPPSRFVPGTSSSPFPFRPRFTVERTGTTLVLTSWNDSEDPSSAGPSCRELNSRLLRSTYFQKGRPNVPKLSS